MSEIKINKDLPDPIYDFLDYLKRDKNYSDTTIKSYESDLTIFARWILYHMGLVKLSYKSTKEFEKQFNKIDLSLFSYDILKKITEDDIREYFVFAQDMLKLGVHTKTRKIASLKSFFKYLINRKKKLKNNPVFDLEYPKKPERKPIFLTVSDVKKLLEALKRMNKRFYVRNRCMIILLLNTGIRLSELVNLDLDSIRDDFSYLSIIGKGDKERFVPLNNTCKLVLKKYLEVRPSPSDIKPNSQNALFISRNYNRISIKGVHDIIKEAVRLASLPKYLSTHKLRHTFATHMYEVGAADVLSLQELLGHDDITSTKIYTSVSSEKLRNAVNRSPFNKELE